MNKKKKVDMRLSISDRIGLWLLPVGVIIILIGAYFGFKTGLIIYVLAFTAPGFPFAIMGAFFQILIGRDRKKKQALLDDGSYVVAEITGIGEAGRSGKKGRRASKCYYKAETEDKLTGKRHVFQSEVVPVGSTKLELHDRIRVYVNTADYSVYYMELEPFM